MLDMSGKAALVTGGASGIGRATAQRLAELGASVAIGDVSPDGKAVADEIGAQFVELDVSDLDSWREAAQHVADTFGQLDLVHLNAGVNTPPTGTPFGDDPLRWVSAQGYRRVTGVNIDGVVFGVLACLPFLREQPESDIVVTGSIASVEPLVGDPLYTLSKHAVLGFATALAPTVAKFGVRVQVVCPGGVDTAIVPPDMKVPGRPFAPPSYLADAVVHALEVGATGDIWAALRADLPPARYVPAPIR